MDGPVLLVCQSTSLSSRLHPTSPVQNRMRDNEYRVIMCARHHTEKTAHQEALSVSFELSSRFEAS